MRKEPSRAFRLVDEVEAAPAPIMGEAPPAEVAKKKPVAKEKSRRPATEDDPVAAAVTRAVALLEYGDMSRRKLIRKLTDRGIDPTVAEQAANVMEEKGFLKEADACRRRAEQGIRKGWGPLRITEDLYAQRYPRELIEQVMCDLEDETDYVENCAAVIRKKYRGVPEDRDDRRRMTAALARLGYGMSDIRAAMESVAED